MDKFPALKMIAFFALGADEAYVCYSAPGYGFVTKKKYLGSISHDQEVLYTYEHWPDEESFKATVWVETSGTITKVKYKFPYKRQWESFNYLLGDDEGYSAITSIKFPDSILHIYDFAYSYSNYLEKIILPASIRSIGAKAFAGCEKLAKPELDCEEANLKWKKNKLISVETGETLLTWPTRKAVYDSAD